MEGQIEELWGRWRLNEDLRLEAAWGGWARDDLFPDVFFCNEVIYS